MAKPLLLITGFLGAGKTTLLRALLENLRTLDRSADVILNDFENADIDASTLHDRAASIHPIAASCACCDSLDDLVQLCLASQKSEGDVLLIEVNGTADPLPLLEAFTLLEEKMPFHPRWQIGVVDARHWGRRGEFTPLEQRQIETATLWMPTHTEGIAEPEIDGIVESVRGINPYAKRVTASLLAAELSNEKNTLKGASEFSIGGGLAMGTVSRRGHTLSHRLTGYQIPLPGRHRYQQIIRLLEALPDEVVRAKALVELKETPGSRWLFERVGNHRVENPLEVDGLMRPPTSLVCIGPCLAPEPLLALVESLLEDESHPTFSRQGHG